MAKKKKTARKKTTSKSKPVKLQNGSKIHLPEGENKDPLRAVEPVADDRTDAEIMAEKITTVREEIIQHAIDFFTRKSRSYAKIGFAVQKYLGLLEVQKREKIG